MATPQEYTADMNPEFLEAKLRSEILRWLGREDRTYRHLSKISGVHEDVIRAFIGNRRHNIRAENFLRLCLTIRRDPTMFMRHQRELLG